MATKIRFFMRMIWGDHFYGFAINGIKYEDDMVNHIIIKFYNESGIFYPLICETNFKIKNKKFIGVNFRVRKD